MAAEIWEKTEFVDAFGPIDARRVYHFGVKGTQSESVARMLTSTYFGPVISTTFGTLFRGQITTTSTAFNMWDCDIEYLMRPADIGTFTWSGDGTGEVSHITHSLETVSYPVGTAPDFKGGIGFDGKEFQGVDDIVPAGQLQITFNHPAGVMTMAYFRYLQSITGYVNSGPFFNWAAGEVRFLGPICSDGSVTDAQAIYNFKLESNVTNLTVGTITGINKLGHNVLWIHYLSDTSTVDGVTYPVRIPQFVYVERVASTVDFRTALGFG